VKIPRHADVTSQLDYEAELGVVIGKAGRGIKKADAMDYVFGYTVINDFTARDLQKLHRQWFIGKSLDGFCPMGPFLVTADEVDGQNIDVKCWVNGELRQNSNTKATDFRHPDAYRNALGWHRAATRRCACNRYTPLACGYRLQSAEIPAEGRRDPHRNRERWCAGKRGGGMTTTVAQESSR
jgi:hypothetical protein